MISLERLLSTVPRLLFLLPLSIELAREEDSRLLSLCFQSKKLLLSSFMLSVLWVKAIAELSVLWVKAFAKLFLLLAAKLAAVSPNVKLFVLSFKLLVLQLIVEVMLLFVSGMVKLFFPSSKFRLLFLSWKVKLPLVFVLVLLLLVLLMKLLLQLSLSYDNNFDLVVGSDVIFLNNYFFFFRIVLLDHSLSTKIQKKILFKNLPFCPLNAYGG